MDVSTIFKNNKGKIITAIVGLILTLGVIFKDALLELVSFQTTPPTTSSAPAK